MQITKSFQNFEDKLDSLKTTVEECDLILISDETVDFIYNHANFLTKSFLINLCGYLETYLKDVLELLLLDYNEIITRNNIPQNLIRWSLETKLKADTKVNSLLDPKHCRYEGLSIKLRKKDLDAFISGNPFRTRQLFEMFGVNLEECSHFISNKEQINLIVEKRNKVLHHNDDASDLSNSDIILYIQTIKQYALEIDKIVENRILNRQYCTERLEP